MKLSDVKKACAICSRLNTDEFIIPCNQSKLRIFMANNTNVQAKWSEYLKQNLTKFNTSAKLYLCSLHFTDDDFKKDDGKLKPDAMPKVKIGVVNETIQEDDYAITEPNLESIDSLVTMLEDPIEEVLQSFELEVPVANLDYTINEPNLSMVADIVTAFENFVEEQPSHLNAKPETITEKCVICANFENFDVNNSEKEVTYYSFPTSVTSQRDWKEAITRHKPGLDFDASKAWVCSLHFPQNALASGARNGWKHSMAPQVVFHSPRVITPPPIERPKPKQRTGPECVICLGLEHYFPTSSEAHINDRPRVFVNFPSNKTMRTLWTKIILTKFPATKIMTPNICTRHFLDTDFDASGQLVWHATPVIPILPPAPEVPEIKDDDVSEWMPPDLIEFESVQLTPENADICSLNAGMDATEGLATCTFLFTKPSVLVRVCGMTSIKASQEDLQIMGEFEKFVSEAELEYLTRLNEFYIEGVPPDEDPADQPSNCRICLNQKDLISINEHIQSKNSSKSIAEWLMLFCPAVKIGTTDKLSQKVCVDCKIEVLYAINLRMRAEDSNGALKKMLHDCDNSIEMVPMCRICMDDTDLQPIEGLKPDIEVITDFEIELDNGLPNYICKIDEVKIKATMDFFEKVQQGEVIQRQVLLSGQGVSNLFPLLPSPETMSEEEKEEYEELEEPSIKDDEIIEILDSDEEELVKSPEFDCKKCEERFNSLKALNDHKRTVHYVAVPRQCDICAEILPDAYKLRLHTLTEHYQGDEIYECGICQHMFKHQLLLDDHVKRCQMVQAINRKNPLKVWACHYCRFKTFLETLYREHLLIHGDKYQCHHCHKYFPLKRRLLTHFTSRKSPCNRRWQEDAYFQLQKRRTNSIVS